MAEAAVVSDTAASFLIAGGWLKEAQVGLRMA